MNLLKRILLGYLRNGALKYNRFPGLYRKFCRPSSLEYAQYLRSHGGFHSIGADTSINIGANITDPAYVSIGNNCTLSNCTLLGHDGVVRIINNAYNKKIDSVGKIVIHDNSFIGHGVIIMQGLVIGPNSVVAAGAVVTRDVPPHTVVGGVPAKPIATIQSLVDRLEARSNDYPWIHLIRKRVGAFDPAMEPDLIQMRVKHFYGD
jgi:acetyltransferase-like isoleucine patch superfamily enzyme